jgi:hypothetical protein
MPFKLRHYLHAIDPRHDGPPARKTALLTNVQKSFALSGLMASSRMKEQPMSDEKPMGQAIQI